MQRDLLDQAERELSYSGKSHDKGKGKGKGYYQNGKSDSHYGGWKNHSANEWGNTAGKGGAKGKRGEKRGLPWEHDSAAAKHARKQ